MRKVLILIVIVAICCTTASARMIPMPSLTVPSDTTRYGEDDEEDEAGTASKEPKRPPRDLVVDGYNAINDVMEGRYVPVGETFINKPKWLRNLYVQGGVGMEMITPPTEDYKIAPMRYVQLGVAKNFNKLYTARVMFHGAWGEERYKNLMLSKMGVKVEHLYDLSSYMSGYNPSRLVGLSTILGLGLQSSKMEMAGNAMSVEGHFGFQFRFFTGPKAYITVEPYVGVGGDGMDVSGDRNWRKKDVFYGANINFVYYINNNLSPESHRRLLADQHEHNRMSTDSLMEKWQQPWFIQLSTGPALMQEQPNLSVGKTMGSEIAIAGGKWLSPVIGLRGGLYSRTNVWRQTTPLSTQATGSNTTDYLVDLHNVMVGGRLEAIFNPMGFLKNFYWDAPFGFYLFGGAEMGWLLKTQSERLSCSTTGWGGGINLWYQLSPGLKVFIEPRLMHNDYKVPYTNVEWVKRYSDNYFSLNMGMAVEFRDDARYYEHSYYQEFVDDRLRKIKVGLGGGFHLLQTERTYSGGSSIGLNGLLFGEYHFDRLKSVRLGIEYVTMKRSNLTQFMDYNMDYPEVDYAPVLREGLWDHKYNILLISASGQVDLNYLTMHYQSQQFRLYAFGGPTAVYVTKYQRSLSPNERLMHNHKAEPLDAEKVGFGIGAHLGLKFEYHINTHLTAFFVPTVYTLGSAKMPGVEFTNLKLMETFNIGAQYSF